jgi:hypothetical protein
MIALGIMVGLREGWSIQESIYFAFVSGLTIGYGDLAPKTLLARTLAILIGLCGVLFTALLAAVAVKALTAASGHAASSPYDVTSALAALHASRRGVRAIGVGPRSNSRPACSVCRLRCIANLAPRSAAE